MLLTLLILALPACLLVGYFIGCKCQAGEMREEVDRYRRVELAAYRKVVAYWLARQAVGVQEIEIGSN